MDRGFLSFLKPRIEAIKEYLTPEDAGQLRLLMKTAKPGEHQVAIEQAKAILGRTVERKATRSVANFAAALGRNPTQQELNTRFADDPTVLETIAQSPVLAPLRQQYGLTGTKAAGIAEEKLAGEKSLARIEAEAGAAESGKQGAKGADLSQDLRDILQRKGMAQDPKKPTDDEITAASRVHLKERIDVSASQGVAAAKAMQEAALDLPLSRTDAEAFGVKFGTTPRQAQGLLAQSPATREAIGSLKGALAIVDDIAKYSAKVNTAQGVVGRTYRGFMNSVGALIQSNDDAVLLQSKSGTLSLLIRALGEKGTLAEGDVARGLALIPNLWDKDSIAKAKIEDLRGLFKNIGESKVPTPLRPGAGPEPKAATQADVMKALTDAGGDKAKARDLLIRRGFSGSSPVR